MDPIKHRYTLPTQLAKFSALALIASCVSVTSLSAAASASTSDVAKSRIRALLSSDKNSSSLSTKRKALPSYKTKQTTQAEASALTKRIRERIRDRKAINNTSASITPQPRIAPKEYYVPSASTSQQQAQNSGLPVYSATTLHAAPAAIATPAPLPAPLPAPKAIAHTPQEVAISFPPMLTEKTAPRETAQPAPVVIAAPTALPTPAPTSTPIAQALPPIQETVEQIAIALPKIEPTPVPAAPRISSDANEAFAQLAAAAANAIEPEVDAEKAYAYNEESANMQLYEGKQDGLSTATRSILATLPRELVGDKYRDNNTPKRSVRLSRVDPEASSLPEKNIASHESFGMKIDVKRKNFNIDYELEKAYTALISGNAEEAAGIYRRALSAAPNNEMALFGLATTYHRIGMLDAAREYYGQLLHLNPNHTEALNNFLGLVGEESPEEAIPIMTRLQQKNKDFSAIPAQLSLLYQRIGDYPSAIDAMKDAIWIAPENLVYVFNLAVLLDQSDNYNEALSVYKTLLEASHRGQEIPADMNAIKERVIFLSAKR